MRSNGSGGSIQSVERAFSLMEALEALGGEARLTELARSAGLSDSTAHNILNTLIGIGYVRQERTRYALDLRLRKLSRPLEDRETRLRETFSPALRAFADMTGENCFLAVACGTRSYLTLDALNADGKSIRLPDDPLRDALITSAVGKVFLAHNGRLAERVYRRALADAHARIDTPVDAPATVDTSETPSRPDVRSDVQPDAPAPLPQWSAVTHDLGKVIEEGFALDLQASERGTHCVALPLRAHGKVVAALSASGPATRLDARRMRRLAHGAMRHFGRLVGV